MDTKTAQILLAILQGQVNLHSALIEYNSNIKNEAAEKALSEANKNIDIALDVLGKAIRDE